MDRNVYTPVLLEFLKDSLTEKDFRTHNLPKFIFLCGKSVNEENSNRDSLVEFYRRIGKNDVFCLYAEKLWDLDISNTLDLLTFEDFLAELSDHIILFVESFGTACELGAFAMKESLVKKLIVIEFNSFKNESSFINDGPIKKVLNEKGSNVFYVDDNAIFSDSGLHDLLINITAHKKSYINKNEKKVNLNSFIVEILELITLLGPINKKDLISVYKHLKGFSSFKFEEGVKNVKISYILKLLSVSNLIQESNECYKIVQNEFRFINFMFDISEYKFMKFRTQFLTRKFKYEKGFIA